MKLSSAQFAAAERGGCRFSPASPAEVQRFSMQSRIFWCEGQAFTARSATGFQETAGTLSKLIARHEQPVPADDPGAGIEPPTSGAQPEPAASPARADTSPPQAAVAPVSAPPTLPSDSQDAVAPRAAAPEGASPGPVRTARPTRGERTRRTAPNGAAEQAVPPPRIVPSPGATASSLLRPGVQRTTALALSIVTAQTAGTQIAGGDFVTLMDRVHQTLSTL